MISCPICKKEQKITNFDDDVPTCFWGIEHLKFMGKPKEEEKLDDDQQDEEHRAILHKTKQVSQASKGVFEKINHFKDISLRIQEKQTEISKENQDIGALLESANDEIPYKPGNMFALFREFKARCSQFNKQCTEKVEPLVKKQEDLLADFISMGRDVVREGKKLLLELGVAETAQAEADDWKQKEAVKVEDKVDKVVAKKVEKVEGEDPYAGYKKVLTGGVRQKYIQRTLEGEKKLVLRIIKEKKADDLERHRRLQRESRGTELGLCH